MNFQVIPIFPKTLLSANLGRKVSDAEINAIKKLDYLNNDYNLISKNTYVLDVPEFKELKFFFQSVLDCYTKEILKDQELDIYITQSWVNVTTENQGHHSHWHPNSFLSGVFYVDVDPEVDKIVFERDKNAFLFITNPIEFNLFNSNTWTIGAKNGDLLIFSSDLRHSVPIKKESNIRISISFNTFLKGTIGNETSLTKLNI